MNRPSRLAFIILISSFSTLGYVHSALGAILPIERAALIALYNSTDGDNWTDNSGWKEPPLHTDGFAMPGTENTWQGVAVSSDSVRVVNLHSNLLTGSIPPELGDLANLKYLSLDSNQLTGSIPTELGDLANLHYLYLHSNQLIGKIPPKLMNLNSLSNLKICDNHLYATDPALRAFLEALQPGWEDCQTPPYGKPIPWILLL